MRARNAIFVIVAAVALVGATAYGVRLRYRLSAYAEGLKTVAIGDTTDTVIREMGEPDRVQRKPHWLWCTAATCESEFMYGTSLPQVWWVAGFDHEGHVVWTAELKSP